MITIDSEEFLDCDEVAARLTGTIVTAWTGDVIRRWAEWMEIKGRGNLIGLRREPDAFRLRVCFFYTFVRPIVCV